MRRVAGRQGNRRGRAGGRGHYLDKLVGDPFVVRFEEVAHALVAAVVFVVPVKPCPPPTGA